MGLPLTCAKGRKSVDRASYHCRTAQRAKPKVPGTGGSCWGWLRVRWRRHHRSPAPQTPVVPGTWLRQVPGTGVRVGGGCAFRGGCTSGPRHRRFRSAWHLLGCLALGGTTEAVGERLSGLRSGFCPQMGPHLRGDHLSGERSPVPSSSLLEGCRRKRRSLTRRRARVALPPRAFPSAWPCSRWGCLAVPVTSGTPVVSYTTFSPCGHGGCPWFAVCLCGPVRGSPRPGVTRHRTLWSPDFLGLAADAVGRDHPAHSSIPRVSPPWYRGGLTSMSGWSRATAFGTSTPECDTYSELPLRSPETLARVPNARLRYPRTLRKVRKPCEGKRRRSALWRAGADATSEPMCQVMISGGARKRAFGELQALTPRPRDT